MENGTPPLEEAERGEDDKETETEEVGGGHTLKRSKTYHHLTKHELRTWSPARRTLGMIVRSEVFDGVLVFIIFMNMVFIVVEANAGVNQERPGWMRPVGFAFLAIYVVEIVLRMFVERVKYFSSAMNIADFSVVLLDLLSQVAAELLGGKVPSIAVLRVFRVMRLLRVIRSFNSFRELWLMLHGLAAAMKAMVWACVLIAVVLIIWSIVAVEVLQPMMTVDMFEDECGRCMNAFNSVDTAVLTWFIMIFAGDMWSELAVPLIEKQPLTAIIFLSAFVSINLGMLNLILTVIVDRASEARADDEHQKVLDKKNEFARATTKLTKLCELMDEDKSGYLTLEELEGGYDSQTDFQDALKVMDVAREDIKTVFAILDEDKSGTVTYSEFVDQLHKMKSQESHTLLVFIKHYITDVRTKVSEQLDLFKDQFLDKMEGQDQDIKELFKKISTNRKSGPSSSQIFDSEGSGVKRQVSPGSESNLSLKGNQVRSNKVAANIMEPLIRHIDEQIGHLLEESSERSRQQLALNDALINCLMARDGSQHPETDERSGFLPSPWLSSSMDVSQKKDDIGAVVVPVLMKNPKNGSEKLVVPVQVIGPVSGSGGRKHHFIV